MSESGTTSAHGDQHSPAKSPRTSLSFLIPSPVPTRRTRTYSQSERAKQGPTFKGEVKDFCRERGHGFIKQANGDDDIFFHISDIDGEIVPKPGDEVTYKRLLIPPKNEKFSAVHVTIIHMKPGVTHETWEQRSPSASSN